MDRVTADAQNVTTVGSQSHVGSQTIGEVRHRLVDAWQLFPDGLQATFNSQVVLDFGWGLFYSSSMASQI